MKILQVTTFFAPVVGGVETQVEDLSRELIRAGHEVEIVATSSSRSGPNLELRPQVTAGEAQLSRVRTWFSFTNYHKFAPGFIRIFSRTNADVVHVHGFRKPELFLALFICGVVRRKRVVVSTHNPFTTRERGLSHRFFIAIADIAGFFLLPTAHHFFCLSQAEIPILKKFRVPGSKISVVGNAITIPKYVPFVKSTGKKNALTDTITKTNDALNQGEITQLLDSLGVDDATTWDQISLCVGRMNEVKGFQFLEQAVADHPNTLFLFLGGDDGYLGNLRRQYRDYDNAIFSEFYLPRERLQLLYEVADVFLLPSVHEPFGIVLIEAMASGCAVIATRNGGPVEILEDGKHGLLQDPEDTDQWSRNLSKLFDNREELEIWQTRAQKRAQKFSWKKILPVYLENYS